MSDIRSTLYEELCKKLRKKLRAFTNGTTPLRAAALDFFAALGYHSDLTLDIGGSVEEFCATYDPQNKLAHPAALKSSWRSIDLLFQLTDQELSGEIPLFKDTTIQQTLLHSYVFFAIELAPANYARGKLAAITRHINRLFPMPVMVLFKVEGASRSSKVVGASRSPEATAAFRSIPPSSPTLTLAVINRRQNKRDSEKDVLGRVTLIRNIDTANPHRGHLDILASFSTQALRDNRHPINSFDTLHVAWEKIFNVQLLNKSFYNRLADWYKECFDDIQINLTAASRILGKDVENELKPQAVIRVIIRLLFIWFMKEKGLIDGRFFTREFAAEFVKKENGYYNAILQNLFFAVLNKKITERRFRKEDSKNKYDPEKNDYGISDTFRHKAFFNPGKADVFLEQTQTIPFVNGGLFVCHDYKFTGTDAATSERNSKQNYIIDGFSDAPKDRATISDATIFDLLDLFDDYVFTIEESTPTEQDIALDPELLGTVFENLIASYNSETKENARKQTGSFYTPREIVDYMCAESLKESLKTRFPKLQTQIGELLDNHEDQLNFPEKTAVIAAITDLKILDPACGSGAFPMGMFLLMVRTIEKLQEHKTTYKNKLDIITSCIYGIDIQNIAIEISKLRFFISLLVDYPTPEKIENFEVLPNLETKFVVANTLVGINFDDGDLWNKQVFEKTCNELTAIFTPFTTARTPSEKTKIKNSFELKKQELVTLFEQSRYDSSEIEKIRAWNPFNVCYSSPFFDSGIMFGITNGFDIVIGNPPYKVVTNKEERKQYEHTFIHQDYQRDLYLLFFERASHFIQENGILSYITPNTWFYSLTFKKIRTHLCSCYHWITVLLPQRGVFEAIVDNSVVVFRKNHQEMRNPVRIELWKAEGEVSFLLPWEYVPSDGSPINVSIPPEYHELYVKIKKQSHLLSSRFDVFNGVKPFEKGRGTPPQDDTVMRDKPYVAEGKCPAGKFWRPLLRGSLIERYKIRWDDDYWIKYGQWLAAPRDVSIFNAPEKICVRQTGDRIVATLVDGRFIERDNLHIILPGEKDYSLFCLLGVLNSKVTHFVYSFMNPEQGEALAQVKKEHVEHLLIPDISPEQQVPFVSLVHCIIAAKRLSESMIAAFLDNLIDACALELYFREHMAERNLLFLEKLTPFFSDFNSNATDEAQRAFITTLYSTLNAPDAKVRNQLLRLIPDSPDLLGIILKA